jgi:hypothetical protein
MNLLLDFGLETGFISPYDQKSRVVQTVEK